MVTSLTAFYNARIAPMWTGSELRRRMARGGMWLGIGSFGENGFRMIRNMILTRLLAPEAFGLMAIVLAVNMFFESFTQIGLREAVIQNERGDQRPFLNTALWLSAGRGIVLFILGYILTPWIADFYGQPELIPMMRVAFIGILFFGVLSPRSYAEVKKMNYRRWVLLFHGGSLVGIMVAILLGFYMRNIWALVIGATIEYIARTVLSYIVCPFMPSFDIDRESLRSLLKFARGMFGLPIMTFIYLRADVFVIGKFCTPDELGMYSLANSIVQIPFMFFSSVINPILLPAFSPLQGDLPRLSARIIRSSRMQSLLFLPGLTLVACAAAPILTIVYGSEYAVVSIPFTILCGSMAIRISGAVITSALIAIGRPDYTREASLIRVIFLAVAIVPLVMKFGLVGAAIANLTSGALWFGVSLYRTWANIKLSATRYALSLWMGVAISLVIASVYLIVRFAVLRGSA